MTDNPTQHTDTAEATAIEVPAEQVIPAKDLGELLDGAIRKAVTAQINAQAKEIAEGVVEAMLTKEVIAGMRETAIYEAELALNPAPEPEPEPEPEPQLGPEEAAEEEEAEPRELQFPTVKEFVEDYVIEIYRREVSIRNAPEHWCPLWWVHGEVVARFEALHMAFEHLRHGEETELAAWWLVYFDPMMERIFDKEGPFKYCSVAEGHRGKLPKLPVVTAPLEAFEDGYYDQPVIASQLVVPAASVGRSRTVMTVDEAANIVNWPEFP
jgi:hypothetical protein